MKNLTSMIEVKRGRMAWGMRLLLVSRHSLLAGILGLTLLLISHLGAIEEWTRTFGTPDMNDGGQCIGRTADGGYIVSGIGASNKMGVARLDSLGEVIWYLNHLPVDMDDILPGGLIVTVDQSCILLGGACAGNDARLLYLLKLGPAGDSLWARRYSFGTDGFYPYDLRPTHDGGMIAVGERWSNSPDVPSVCIVRFNSQGDTIWTQGIGLGDTIYEPYAVVETRDGGFLVGGGIFDNLYAWLLKLDSLGNKTWYRVYGDRRLDYECVAVDTIAGESDCIMAGTLYSEQPADCWPWLVRVTQDGDVVWTRTYDNSGIGFDISRDVCRASDGGWLITGDLAFGMGDVRGLLLRVDKNGRQLWTRLLNNQNCVHLEAGLSIPDSGYVTVGVAHEPDHGAKDFYIARVRDSGLTAIASPEGPLADDETRLWLRVPRVCAGRLAEIEFYLPQPGSPSLAVFDMSGRKLAEPVSGRLGAGWHSTALPASLPNGVYVVRLAGRTGAATSRMLLLR